MARAEVSRRTRADRHALPHDHGRDERPFPVAVVPVDPGDAVVPGDLAR